MDAGDLLLAALADGRALTAVELARGTGIGAPAALARLGTLMQAGQVVQAWQGRHRYFRAVAPDPDAIGTLRTGPRSAALRAARTCHGHLAGPLAVAIAAGMVARSELLLAAEGATLTPAGAAALRDFGIGDPQRLSCRPCLDWSERRLHLAGQLGAALCAACLSRGWFARADASRALVLTDAGRRGLPQRFGVAVA